MTSSGAHLVFLPRPAGGPAFLLWRRPSGDGDAPRDDQPSGDRGGRQRARVSERAVSDPVGELARRGKPASALVVTETLRVEEVAGVAIPLADALPALVALAADSLERLPPSVAAWSLATKLALDLIARERILPLPLTGAAGGSVRWGVSLALPNDADRFRRLALALPPAAHAVPRNGAGGHEAPSARVWSAEDMLLEFLDGAAETIVRHVTSVGRPTLDGARWEQRFLRGLIEADGDAPFLAGGVVERGLLRELIEWAAPVRGALATRTPRLCIKLDLPADERAPWRLEYYLQAADDPSLLLPAPQIWASTGARVDWMNHSFAAPQETLLRELGRAGRLFPPIEASLESPSPSRAPLPASAAWYFIAQTAPLLTEAGFGVMLPAELSPSGQRRLRLRMLVGERAGRERGGNAGAATGGSMSMDSLVNYRWEAAVGDQALSAEEFKQLVALKRPLVQWRGQWVLLDPSEVTEVQRALHDRGRLTMREALSTALGETMPQEGSRPPVDVIAEGPLAGLLEKLRDGVTPAQPPADLVGELRPYQQRGLGWLSTMSALDLGGCLADDMGLGKTVQTIAYLLARRASTPADERPALIVCPTSVVGNWERELARFAPTLPVVRHHGPGRARTRDALAEAPPHAVIVTTYATLRRDRAVLGEMDWAVAILDEAQNVKNPSAQQAAAARALTASHRFALTGTPVENRLAELWSILEFCVPGFLGALEPFRREYALPIERYRDAGAAERLRRLVRPFILRRLKSDPAVVADLPAKQEMSVVCTLTREQATLYQAAVDDAMARITRSDGIERRGNVLALLTALKQICNHPAHYLKEKGPLPRRSGKLTRLTEMLEETVAAGDRALVFTQYREMGDRLVAHLESTLGIDTLFLHGGVPREARDAMVRRFQEDPLAPNVFVLSLRAGGTGLNLTRATRVFHFDRWWNPAVEDQATDRAHRIGQERVVQVYRLLAAGTLEEKIDRMLVEKRDLADRIVGEGETWITELSDAELRGLVTLSGDATVADEDAE